MLDRKTHSQTLEPTKSTKSNPCSPSDSPFSTISFEQGKPQASNPFSFLLARHGSKNLFFHFLKLKIQFFNFTCSLYQNVADRESGLDAILLTQKHFLESSLTRSPSNSEIS